MGCNAWNHHPACDCGWGGDTGGGSYSIVRHLRPADGLAWSRRASISIESYTRPNACCPVCGDTVFFYQSPHGGRVFFDDLGPPWPKHPCTDNGRLSSEPLRRWRSADSVIIAAEPASHAAKKATETDYSLRRWAVRAWKPLLSEEVVTHVGEIIWITAKIRIKGTISLLPIPREAWCDAPIYWRWSEEPGYMEVETINAHDVMDVRTIRAKLPAWLENGDDVLPQDVLAMEMVPECPPDRWNSLDWDLSFHWALKDANTGIYDIAKECGWVDWDLARACFERAAESGDWAGANNLGAIYRDGQGVEKNPALAFRYFEQAANRFEDRALENFARCYREGIGCDADHEMAEFIESLRSLSPHDANGDRG